jgi:DNA-binding response OmpR family regulator
MSRILCIDPDAGRAEEPVEVLRSAGYEVMLAFSPEVGIALVWLFPPDIVLLDSDLAERLAPQIRQACPAAPVVLTGKKPVSVEELRWLASHQRAGVQAQDVCHLPH